MDEVFDPKQETERALYNIRKLRELKNITREHVADELELSPSGYAKIERGEIELTLDRLYRIASVLGVDVSQILNSDVRNVFNINSGTGVVGNQNDPVYNYYSDNYREKYISKLEEENERLKHELAALKSR